MADACRVFLHSANDSVQVTACSQVVFVAGVVHCCLSPDSILLKPGLAGVTVQVSGFEASHLSRYMETKLFTAPEVSQGNFTAAADLWSLGSMMCLWLLGQAPCRDANGKLHCQNDKW